MINETEIPRVELPSKSRIAMATLFALIVAAIVLVVAVLPAEYGIDPLGTGQALGLLALNEAGNNAAPATAKPVVASGLKKGEIRTAPALAAWNKDQTRLYKVDYREMTIAPGQGMEFKYRLVKGDGMVYSWIAPTKVRFEFHGEPEGSPKGTYESYGINETDGVERGNGTFIAPFTGIHGWWWENISDKPITVQLSTSGFFTGGKEFRKDFEGNHELTDVKMGPGK
jgi:hypothetical protein